ncbi:MAG: diguanylate cyclase domain-containing protein [Lachnospiraceae bacterium]
MKSIQTKITLLILVGMLACVVVIGSTGIISFGNEIDHDSTTAMNLVCNEKAQELNNIFGKIEQSVKILSVYAVDNLESVDRLSEDAEYLKEYTQELEELGLTVANKTDGAVAVYMRFSPTVTPSTEGFFHVRNMQTDRFEAATLTDLSMYSSTDKEHVGWYYTPVRAGKAVWMQPYSNENIDIYMISYVIPIYKDTRLIGIVGMDIDFHYITSQVDSIHLYETGNAFLTDDEFHIVHSKNFESGISIDDLSESIAEADAEEITGMDAIYEYVIDGEKKRTVFQSLENGMYLAVTAPVSEIDSIKNDLIKRIVVRGFLICIFFLFLAWLIARTFIRPLKELNDAARDIAAGHLDVSLTCKSKDEVGTLTASVMEMASQLKRRIDYINGLAYIDKLTGVKNNTAYLHEVSMIQIDMENGGKDFALFIIDVNGLKFVNDTYGHDCGNQLIVDVSEALVEVFGHENCYRIGGDEFAVIIRNSNRFKCSERKQEFISRLGQNEDEISPSAAVGYAFHDKETDESWETVFKRADKEMYKEKQEMKSRKESSFLKSRNTDNF